MCRSSTSAQAQFGSYCLCLFKHDAMRLEQGIDVPRGTTRVIRQRHRGAAEHVDVRYHIALSQPVTEPSEGLFDALAAE